MNGGPVEVRRSARRLLIFAGMVTLALNIAEPLIAGQYGKAADRPADGGRGPADVVWRHAVEYVLHRRDRLSRRAHRSGPVSRACSRATSNRACPAAGA
ncbi:hypothetical protein Franean1_4646 [Parafrankia sp. EAN1pec]|nr:hypothetical protein Franean1_4646 [Frankia sp. EAN1pec]